MTKLLRILMYTLLFTKSFGHASIQANTSTNAPLKYNLVEGMPDLYLTPISEKIGHTWVNGIVWEKHLIRKFYSLLAAHNGSLVVIDLGAQTGSFSLLAKYFPNSIWHAFEPIQEAADALKENLLLNNITNVSVHQKAASNFSGKTILQMPNMNEWGLSTIGSNVLRFTTALKREVECIDIDSFISANNIKRVHFMKLDTEGSEFYILLGAKKMIMRDHPIILMEYNETNMKQCGVLKQDIDQLLKEMGYEWKMVSSEDIMCIPNIF